MQFALKLPGNFLRYSLLGSIYLLLSITFLTDYFTLNASTILGLVIAPYLVIFSGDKRISFRYLVPAVAVCGLSWVVPGKSGIYFSLVLALLFTLESIVGKINNLLLFLLFILSPLFQFVLVSFGFPIRLWLSKITVQLLSVAGFQAETMGNVIVLNGNEFSVDPACMGLNMLHISFILGLFILAYLERLTLKRLTIWQVILFLCFLSGLNILSNLLRIMLLAIFKVLPEQFMHEVTGLLCFTIYVLLPFYYLSHKVLYFLPDPKQKRIPDNFLSGQWGLTLTIILLLCIGARASFLPDSTRTAALADINCSLPGFTKKKLASGVIQFQKPEALVYVKPVDTFYRPEHTPLICWTGSGYSLQRIKEITTGRFTIYTGILRKDQDLLYTAWWFDNGQGKTIEQFKWL